MIRRVQVVIGVAALAVIVVCLGLQASLRITRSHRFGQAHHVRTHTGTNYVARLSEATLGRVGGGYVILLYLSVDNPNPFELTLNRNDFILVDEDKDYYQPSAAADQPVSITVPARGMREAEMLSYTVEADALRGSIGLQLGHYYWVAVKSDKPYAPQLRPDEFRSFKQLDWHD